MGAEDVDIRKVKEPLLSYSVLLLFVYMLLIGMYHGTTNNNAKDEDFIGCTCRHKDKAFYTAIFTLFTIFWGIGVFAWFVVRLFSFLIDLGSTILSEEMIPKRLKHYYDQCIDESEYDITNCQLVMLVVLELFSFAAHLGVLPLLFVQLLSTYAWVCTFGNKYCQDGAAPNQLQIDRTGVLFGFLFCATVIGFAASMIRRYKNS